MNGLSDVRLTLHGPQLEAEHGAVKDVFQPRSAPACLGRWGLFAHRFNTRRVLRNLDADQLRDVGLNQEQARQEGCKPFWRS